MRYFEIKQDKYLPYTVVLRDFIENNKHVTFYKSEIEQINETSTLYVAGEENQIYPDFIENPVYMVSAKVKKVLSMYELGVQFKTVVWTNQEQLTQQLYYHVLTDHIEGLSQGVEYYPDGREKTIILDREKVKAYKVFQLLDSTGNQLFVSLDVVESLLRRDVVGIIFEEVEVI